jgi:hypothetical protein
MLNQESARPVAVWRRHGQRKTEACICAPRPGAGARPGAQVLVMVPEINSRRSCRPGLEGSYLAPSGSSRCTVSRRPSGSRGWPRDRPGAAGAGTRMAVSFTRCRTPGLIVVDEEHDPSYKQQEGAHLASSDRGAGTALPLKTTAAAQETTARGSAASRSGRRSSSPAGRGTGFAGSVWRSGPRGQRSTRSGKRN